MPTCDRCNGPALATTRLIPGARVLVCRACKAGRLDGDTKWFPAGFDCTARLRRRAIKIGLIEGPKARAEEQAAPPLVTWFQRRGQKWLRRLDRLDRLDENPFDAVMGALPAWVAPFTGEACRHDGGHASHRATIAGEEFTFARCPCGMMTVMGADAWGSPGHPTFSPAGLVDLCCRSLDNREIMRGAMTDPIEPGDPRWTILQM